VDGLVLREQGLQLDERVVGGVQGWRRVERVEDPGSAPRLEPEEGLGAEEAEPADLLAADHALEQEEGAERSIFRKAETA